MNSFSKKRSGGPRSAEGKARSSRNALKTGIAVSYWLEDAEQAEYDALVEALTEEYGPTTATVRVLIDRLASVLVKLHRHQRKENALYQEAKITAEYVARQQEKAEHSLASYLPKTAGARELALQVASDGAMPDLERLALLARYQGALDRQISALLADLRRITRDNRKAPRPAQVLEPVDQILAVDQDIEDVTARSADSDERPR